MAEPFSIVVVPPDASRFDEQLGTKPKFWFETDDRSFLFKRGRPNEDWSEKIGTELAGMMGLPIASVELAICDGEPGVVSEAFLHPDQGDILSHGNELLLQRTPDYPFDQDYRVREHTLEAVFDVLGFVDTQPWDGLKFEIPGSSGSAQFVGYLILDAWIGNTDRHHENWGVMRRAGSPRPLLAPTYDHASSLGIRETISRIATRLGGSDPRVTVPAYADRCRSAFYPPGGDTPMTTFAAFEWVMHEHGEAAKFWLDRLERVTVDAVDALFDRVPPQRISVPHRRLAGKILEYNRQRLLGSLASGPTG